MIRKNKKAFLLAETTVKIIIAVIAIILLAFLLTSLYYSKVKAEKQRDAIRSLTKKNQIGEYVKDVNEGIKKGDLHMPKPLGWYIFSFTGQGIKPNLCAGQNCICICSNVGKISYRSLWTNEEERQIEECDESGACLIISNLKDKDIEIEITTKETYLIIKKDGDKIDISKK